MKLLRNSVILLLTALLLGACHKAPRYAINEDKMVDVLCDLYKADAYVSRNYNDFATDSLKLLVKQSVLDKYGYTLQDYDTSMVWYAHNLDTFNDVYKKVTDRLNEELEQIRTQNNGTTAAKAGKHIDYRAEHMKKYHIDSDSSECWSLTSTMPIAKNMAHIIIPFEFYPTRDMKKGDHFLFSYSLAKTPITVSAVFGIDYDDKSTTFVNAHPASDGLQRVEIITDRSHNIQRIYGYFMLGPTNNNFAVGYIHNISLLRIHPSSTEEPSYQQKTLWRHMQVTPTGNNQQIATDADDSGTTNFAPLHRNRPKTAPRGEEIHQLQREQRLLNDANLKSKDS